MSDDVTSTDVAQQSRIPGGMGGWINPPVRTSEEARALARKRWEGMSRAARAGLADAGEALPAVSKRSPLAVIRYLVEEHAKHASEPGARGAVSSFQQVVKMAYPEPEREAGAVAGGSGLTIHMDADMAQRLIDRLRPGANDADSESDSR